MKLACIGKQLAISTLLAASIPALAQTPPPAVPVTNAMPNQPAVTVSHKEAEQMQPIIVTGSMIPTTDTDGPSPVLTITAADIARRGDLSISDVLQHVPQVNAFSNRGNDGLGFNGGGAFISLRGLGPQATLVLVNGLRTAPFGNTANGQYSFFDLNSISTSDVERIEVLSDGASAIYGSDAVAGVVNIILKKDLGTHDAETNIQLGNTTSKDAFEQSYNQAFGLSSFDKNGNGIISIDYYDRNSIVGTDRSYAATGNLQPRGSSNDNSAAAQPGLFASDDYFTIDPAGFNSNHAPLTAGSPRRVDASQYQSATQYLGIGNTPGYNNYAAQTLIPSSTRYGIYSNYSYKYYDGNVVPTMMFSYRHLRNEYQSAPTPYFDGDISNQAGQYESLVIPAYNAATNTGNYYNRTGQSVYVLGDRFLQLGNRTATENTDDFMAVPSVKIKLGPDWSMNVDVNYSHSTTSTRYYNYVSANSLYRATRSSDPNTAFNFFGANSSSVLSSILADSSSYNTTSLMGQDVTVNGKLFDLPAGPTLLALGVQNRRDEFNQTYSASDISGNTLGSSAQQNLNAYRTVTSGYGEIDIPIFSPANRITGFESFNLYGAGRIDSYSDFGLTANPEIRFRWSPCENLIARGSYSTSFRAPGLTELHAGSNNAYQTVFDPYAPGGPALVNDALIVGGGNPALQPETAESWNLGLVYTPPFIPGLKLNMDFYKIRYNNQITQFSADATVDANPPGTPNSPVVRNSAGDLVSVSGVYQNLASTVVKGMDMGAEYVLGDPNQGCGQLDATFQNALIFNYLTQNEPGSPYIENVGSDSGGLGGYARYRQNGSVFWNYRTFAFGVSNDFTSGYVDSQNPTPNGSGLNPRKSGGYVTFDLQASYEFKAKGGHDVIGKNGIDWLTWLDSTKISLGCDNVAQFTPPFVGNPNNNPVGSDPNYADYRGRFWYVAVKKVW